MAEAEKDDWLDDLDSPGDQFSELDQSGIDSLLADSVGSQTPSPPATSGDNELELDQSAIDAMLSGASEGQSPRPSTTPAAESDDLDQSDIDTLLASPKIGDQEQSVLEPDQDEIDKLFSDIDSVGTIEESSFPAEEVDFKDVFDSADSPPKRDNLDFDAEEFKLDADIPDIPDTKGVDDLGGASSFLDDTVANSLFDEPKPPQKSAMEPEAGRAATMTNPAQEIPTPALNRLRNRKMLFGLGGGLALLLLGGGLFFMKGRTTHPPDKTAAVAVQPPAVKPHEPAPPAVPAESPKAEPAQPHNAAPTVKNIELTIPADSSQIEVAISGTDPENDLLQYVMSLPEHGQLSGQPPNLVYTANPDFSGKDGFIIRATDGKNISPPATVIISRQHPLPAKDQPPAVAAPLPDHPAAELAEKGGEPAKVETIQAKNRSYTLTGSKGQVINWEKIWRDAENFAPYNSDVRIEIMKAPRHGALNKIDNRQSLYLPEPAFKGTDTISYRFKLGKLTSPSQTVTVKVQRKNRAPVIHLQPIAPSYLVGDKVVLNASQTQDDNRQGLTFRWEQLAGVPILIKPLNSEGSQAAFVVPSTFSAGRPGSLRVKVTATDQDGAQDTKEVTIATQSRRTSAIWP